MPILGIMASGMSANLWAPGADFDSIATTTVGAGGASTITFSSIPQTYRHLQIRLFGNADANDIFYQLNGDAVATNYARHYLYGTGASAASGFGSSGSIGYVASTALTSTFGAAIFDVLDYTNTSKNTTTRSLTGFDGNGTGFTVFYSGVWLNTAAVNSITLVPYAGNFNQYTQAALYGVK
jgi:hypothetical protein